MPVRNGSRAWGPAHYPWLTTIATAALIAAFALDGRPGRAVVAAESSAGSVLRPGEDPIALARRTLLAGSIPMDEAAVPAGEGRAEPAPRAAHVAHPVSAVGGPVEPVEPPEPPSQSSSAEPSGPR